MTLFKNLFGKKKANDANTIAMPRQTSGNISIKGVLENKSEAAAALTSISIIQNVQERENDIGAMIVESTDRNKTPYLFIKLKFSNEGASAEYSIPIEIPNPDMRHLMVMKTLFYLISILESKKAFLPERADLFENIIHSFDLASTFSGDLLKMKYESDRNTHDNTKLREEVARLKEEKEGLNLQFLELERKLQSYEERVSVLERMTDLELDREILRWIEEHGGKLSDAHFCKTHNIKGARLDERLDALSKQGVIRIV